MKTGAEKLKEKNAEKEARAKKALLIALESSLGVVTTACEKVGISRNTYYNYLKDDLEFAEKCKEFTEVALDFVESKMYQKTNGVKVKGDNGVYTTPPSDTMIIFYLKCKGKKRGYIERQDFHFTNDGKEEDMTQEEIEMELQRLRNEHSETQSQSVD